MAALLYWQAAEQICRKGQGNMARASRYKEYTDGMNNIHQKKSKDRETRRPVSILRQLKELKLESAKTISQKGGINGQ